MPEFLSVKIKRISESYNDIPLPDYSTEGASGMDIRAAVCDSLIIKPFETKLISTNLILEIPRGYEAQIRPRSGLALKSFIGILNSPGTIDSDYRGEVGIILTNFGKNDFVVNRGDRIAQMTFSKIINVKFISVDEICQTKRNDGGFGHTGVS